MPKQDGTVHTLDGKTSSEPLNQSLLSELYSEEMPLDSHVMEMMAQVAKTCANRHAGCSCVTLGIESIRFLGKIEQGDIVTCSAFVYRVMDTSMEISIKVSAEGLRDLEKRQILSASFIFAALDEDRKYKRLSPVVARASHEKRCFRESEIRRIKRRKY